MSQNDGYYHHYRLEDGAVLDPFQMASWMCAQDGLETTPNTDSIPEMMAHWFLVFRSIRLGNQFGEDIEFAAADVLAEYRVSPSRYREEATS